MTSRNDRYASFAKHVARITGRPVVFSMAVGVIAVWIVTGPIFQFSDTWQLVINTGTTIVTFLMVFLIQNSQNRDAAAMQAKLDELIRAVRNARNEFVGIEHLTDHEIEAIRAALEQSVGADDEQHRYRTSLRQLLKRR